ncbi:MAG: DinB family protein [Gemmatimonadaceae bacterium]|nr:DinB family protein [Gemmatimonadaceae bacterium]
MPTSKAPRSITSIPSRAALVRLLDEAFHGPAWHGPSVKVALRRVDADTALWRPGAGRPNVWEQALHMALGKFIVAQRLEPTTRRHFPVKRTSAWWAPSPTLAEPAARAKAWAHDLALLDACHDDLLATLRRIPLRRLGERHGPRGVVLGQQVAGLVMHDAYHAGQVALVLRLAASARE